jgi:hypothetical protein
MSDQGKNIKEEDLDKVTGGAADVVRRAEPDLRPRNVSATGGFEAPHERDARPTA